jgi:uncharacterized protein (DUF1778 family)
MYTECCTVDCRTGKEEDAMATATLRTERTEARLLPEQKKRIERAAAIKGLSLSDFMVQNADEAAVRTIEQHTSWTLGTKDRDALVRALLHPSKPSRRLAAAAGRYKKRVRG